MFMTIWTSNQMIALHTTLAENAGQLTDAAARVASLDQGGSPITYILTQALTVTNVAGLAAVGGFYVLCVVFTVIWSRKQYRQLAEERGEE